MSFPGTYKDVTAAIDAIVARAPGAKPGEIVAELLDGWSDEDRASALHVLAYHAVMTVRAWPVNPAARSTPKAKPANSERVRNLDSRVPSEPAVSVARPDRGTSPEVREPLTRVRGSRWSQVARLHAEGDLLGQAVTADSGATTLGDCTMNDIVEMARTAARQAKEARVTAGQYIGLIAAMKKANVGTVRDLGAGRVRAALTLEPSEAPRAAA